MALPLAPSPQTPFARSALRGTPSSAPPPPPSTSTAGAARAAARGAFVGCARVIQGGVRDVLEALGGGRGAFAQRRGGLAGAHVGAVARFPVTGGGRWRGAPRLPAPPP